MEKNSINIMIVGNPSVGTPLAIHLKEHNIPFIDIGELTHERIMELSSDLKVGEKILVVESDTTINDIKRVLELENNKETFILNTLPKLDDISLTAIDIESFNQPFYSGLYKKGGKKNKKRFGR